MKTNVLILHGIDGYAGIHWQAWLYDALEKKGYRVFMPDLPNTHHPDRKEWLKTVTSYATLVAPESLILVGHSLGVTSMLDFLENTKKKVRAAVSVSGIAEDYGSELNSYFLREKHIDFTKVREHVEKAAVFYGDNDPYVPQETLKYVADGLGITPIVIPNGGHLNTDAGYTQFPQLLEIIEQL